MELPRRQARKQVAELSVSGAALAGGDLRARFASVRKSTAREARSTKVLVLGVLPPAGASPPCYPYAKVINSAKRDPQGFLCLAYTPPQPGQVPILPVCKSYQRRKKRPAVYPPPIRGRPRYYPYAKVISGAKSGPPCTPPIRGRPRYYPYAKVISSAQSDLRSQMVQALG